MKHKTYFLATIVFALFLTSCKSSSIHNRYKAGINGSNRYENKKDNDKLNTEHNEAEPFIFVYKMRNNYSDNVPVIMNPEKTKIISYPAPADLKNGRLYYTPTKLKNGFWLDNKGIGPDVAFLRYTYKEYSEMTEIPSADELMKDIIDKNPLTFFAFCGKRSQYKRLIKELNTIIDSGKIYLMSPAICPEKTEFPTD